MTDENEAARYRCCEHCAEDVVHAVEPDDHQFWCNVGGCIIGRKARP